MPLVICYQLAQLVKIQSCGISLHMGQLASCRAAPTHPTGSEMRAFDHRGQTYGYGWLNITYSSYRKITQSPCSSGRGHWHQPCLELPTVSTMPSQFIYSLKILITFHPTDHINQSTFWETLMKIACCWGLSDRCYAKYSACSLSLTVQSNPMQYVLFLFFFCWWGKHGWKKLSIPEPLTGKARAPVLSMSDST